MEPCLNPFNWMQAISTIHMTHFKVLVESQKFWVKLWSIK